MKPTFLVAAVFAVACSSGPSNWVLDRPADTFGSPSGSTTPSGSVDAEHASTIVGQAGGKVTVSQGSGVSIPAGALTADVSISISLEQYVPALDAGAPVGPTFLFGPEGQRFEQPVTVTLEFDPAKLFPGESASDIIIYTSPKENPTFMPLATSVVDGSHVSATSTHFSYFVAAHGHVKSLYTIAYSPNSFVIGNAYPGWTDELRNRPVFRKGPGNPNGVNYQCGFLFGESFDHCGWIDRNVVGGSEESAACGSECPTNYDTSLFKSTYTDGTTNPGVSDGEETHMHYAGSGCTDRNGYGNVSPWRVPAKPANSLGAVPDGKLLLWRYVSKDGHWVLVRDPEPRAKEPNWYFVHRGCVSLAPPSHSPPPPPPPACGTLEAGQSLRLVEQIASCNRQYWATLASSGDFIEVELSVGQIWSVAGQMGDHLDMQSDGNLVLYNGTTPIWATMTNGHPGAHLTLGDDGSLGVYDGSTLLWSRN
jgi:hypothetical protein